jgi:hypothetical protein
MAPITAKAETDVPNPSSVFGASTGLIVSGKSSISRPNRSERTDIQW